MKKLIIFTLFTCFLLTGCSSAPKSKAKPSSTPMKAAKTFVQALTTGDEAILNTVIYHSQSMPASEIMNIAKMRKITGMKKTDFTFNEDPEDKNTVMVNFKDSKGKIDKWKLVFVKNNDNNGFQYDGYLSGPLLLNSTAIMAADSYIENLIIGDEHALISLDYIKKPEGKNHSLEIEYVKSIDLKGKGYKPFLYKIYDHGKYAQVITSITDKEGKPHKWLMEFYHYEDGYRYIGDTIDPTERELAIIPTY